MAGISGRASRSSGLVCWAARALGLPLVVARASAALTWTQAADLFLESETDVARFTMIFNNLRALALPPDESAALITSIARDLEA